MIHYHGTPITPNRAAVAVLQQRHGMVSFHRPDHIGLVAEVCQSFVLDNGAFSLWKAGEGDVDVEAYARWVELWSSHPGLDWHLIPDRIDGDEAENTAIIASWDTKRSVPIWHLHESLGMLDWLCSAFDRVAIGSSGEWSEPGRPMWWERITEAMGVVCNEAGEPRARLHGLRMLDPAIFARVPLASADSCNIARNIGLDTRWDGHMYTRALSKEARAVVLAERIEAAPAAAVWAPRARTGQLFDVESMS